MDDHDLLISVIKKSAVPLEPLLPQLPPEWEKLASEPFTGRCSAVIFDVYGTLFCSAAGDIETMNNEQPDRNQITAGVQTRAGTQCPESDLDAVAALYDPELNGKKLCIYFRDKVREIHQSKRIQTDWPEVLVEQIWSDFLKERGLPGSGRELALRYELAVNPVYPMPHAAKAIAALRKSGCLLGIVSNAQFFTPLLFEVFFGGLPEETGFDPDLVIYSFKEGEAKPSPRLFAKLVRKLEKKGIRASDCAFVGNDMLSDIYGAQTAGLQTVLFAGDSRSLKLREGDNLACHIKPSRIIRDLAELIPKAEPVRRLEPSAGS